MSFRVNCGGKKRQKDKSQRHNKLPINNNKTYRSAGKEGNFFSIVKNNKINIRFNFFARFSRYGRSNFSDKTFFLSVSLFFLLL